MKRFWYSEVIRNARLAFPPTWPLILFCLVLGCFERIFGEISEADDPVMGVLLLGAVVYGVYRVAAFHPNLRPAYREWLCSTSWRSPQPLPLGSITLTLTDGVLLLLAAALIWCWHPARSPFEPILVFSLAYLLTIALSLLLMGPRSFGYLVIFGLGGVIMSQPHREIALLVTVGTYFAAWSGLREALKNLRQIETSSLEQFFVRPTGVRAAEIASVNVGWPFGYLAPHRTVLHVPVFDSVCISIVLGWLLASLMSYIRSLPTATVDPGDQFLAGAFWFAASGILIGRMFVHRQHHRPPISLLGRLVTLRWIIPSYDCAYVAPFAGLVLLWTFALPLLRHDATLARQRPVAERWSRHESHQKRDREHQ